MKEKQIKFECETCCVHYSACKVPCTMVEAGLPSPNKGCTNRLIGNQRIENTALSDALDWGISPLRDAINEITDKRLKAVIGLRLVQFSYDDIADLLGMSKSTVAAVLKGGVVRKGRRLELQDTSGVLRELPSTPEESST